MKLSDVAQGRDNNFNIIRISAALAVLISHSFRLSNLNSEPFEATVGVSLGTMAVDVFFVTSGFLVSGSLLTRGNTLEYLCARALRIYPALLVMVALTVLCLGVCFTQAPLSAYFTAPDTLRYVVKNSTLVAGVHYQLPGVFDKNPFKGSVNGSLWSMVHEVRLYLVLALVWVATRFLVKDRTALFKWLMASGAIIFGVWYLAGHFWQMPATGSFVHLAFMFFAGALYYVFRDRVKLSWQTFVCLALILLLSVMKSNLFFIIYNLTAGYLLLFLAYVPAGAIRKYNLLGDYSYGLYIYAFPVQQSFVALFPGISSWRITFYSAPFVLILAMLSWHLIERRALALKASVLNHARRITGGNSLVVSR